MPDGLDKSAFIEPTLSRDVMSDMTTAQEEIFGPVMGALRWDGQETILEAVNDVGYGLAASI